MSQQESKYPNLNIFKNKIDISVLVTSIYQRKITIETVNYFSKICNEVILVDEEEPYLPVAEINKLKIKGITYVPYKAMNYSNPFQISNEKRLIAAKQSHHKYVVHSNHDERYTYNGLLACLTELKKDNNLAFCAGQAVAVRNDSLKIYFTRSYKNLNEYQNLNNKVEQRIYHHAKVYSPIAHYSVWRRELYIKTKERAMSAYPSIHSRATVLDEVIFELAADLAGLSKTITDLYWIRNRINSPYQNYPKLEKGEYSLKITENNLKNLFKDLDNIDLNEIINSLLNSIITIRPKTFLEKSIISIKLRMLNIFKKKKTMKRIEGVDDIYTLLNDNKIKYEKNDLNNLLNSMRL